MIKRIIIMSCLISLIVGVQVNASLAASTNPIIVTYNEPQSELLNLLIDGSGGVWVNITKHFSYILAMTIHLEFISSTLDFDDFGGNTALTNGFAYYYNNTNMLDGQFITANHILGHFDGNLAIFTNESLGSKHRSFYDNIDFREIVPEGLAITPTRSLGFLMRDNMTALTSFEVLIATVRGYYIVQTQLFNEQVQPLDPLDTLTNFLRDNSATLIVMAIFLISASVFWRFWKRRL